MKKIIFVISFLTVFGLLFNFGIPDVQAMTVAEMQALVQQLQRQIAQLQWQLDQMLARPDVWCHNFRNNLRIGDREAEVRALQTALEKQGFYKRAITGNFDEYTASAVVGFQKEYKEDILARWGLVRGTGFVGPNTRAKLNELYGCDRIRAPIERPIERPIVPPKEPSIWDVSARFDRAHCNNFYPFSTTAGELGKTYYTNLDSSSDNLYTEIHGVEACLEGGCRRAFGHHYVNVTKMGPWVVERKYVDKNNYRLLIRGASQADCICGGDGYVAGEVVVNPKNWQITDVIKCNYDKDTRGRSVYCNVDNNTGAIAFAAGSTCRGCCCCIDSGQIDIEVRLTRKGITPSPFIQILSPNGGERWVAGQTHNITWRGVGDVGLVDIILVDHRAGPRETVILRNVAAPGEGDIWTGVAIPGDIVPGENAFTISIRGRAISDDSDRFFSIVAPTPIPTPTVTISASPNPVASGEATILTWSSTNAISCTATVGPGFDTEGRTSGSDTSIALTAATTFTVFCTGPGGNTTASVTVTIFSELTCLCNGHTCAWVMWYTRPRHNTTVPDSELHTFARERCLAEGFAHGVAHSRLPFGHRRSGGPPHCDQFGTRLFHASNEHHRYSLFFRIRCYH